MLYAKFRADPLKIVVVFLRHASGQTDRQTDTLIIILRSPTVRFNRQQYSQHFSYYDCLHGLWEGK